ncbi:hypothetical protein RJ55_00198 [Drechmeria coniospora]|nr:hypothetical protein RJ55_00198 [Drechmeria coniospora]
MMNRPPPDELSYLDVEYYSLLPTQDVCFLDPSTIGPFVEPPSESCDKPTPTSAATTDSLTSEPTAVVRRQPTQRLRLERRGHTKSRRGCYNCKRRRIKCQENHPACDHCVRTGLRCEYPSAPQIIHQPHGEIPLFSLQDMRFFHHFLTQCYPHHPLKQEEIWTHEIPCIAHNHEFLMHAILGFAASELGRTRAEGSVVAAAMNHRVKAIRALKKRLAEASSARLTHEEANVLVATCFVLTFQSVSLDDGLAEYMTFIRGILIVGMQMAFRGIKPVFETLLDDKQNELLAPLMEGMPLIERGWVDGAVEAIAKLRPLCVDEIEVEYHGQLLAIAETLYTSSFDAYKANSREYGWWMMLPHASFRALINFDRQAIILLHTHWIALAQIMAFITERERDVREKHPSPEDDRMDPGFVRWLKYLNARVDGEHQMYNRWPIWVDGQLDQDLTFFGRRS